MTSQSSTLVLRVDSAEVAQADKRLDDMAASGQRAQKSAVMMTSAMQRLSGIVSAGAVAALARQALQTADAYTNMTSRLSLVTKGTRELAEVQRALFTVAQQTRTDLETTTTLYTRLASSTETLGVSQRELISVIGSINQALVISGTSAASSEAALVQLGQAFASGVLRGEELNSVLEQAPRLARAIADGMGVPIGKLRQLGQDGEISAERLFRALQASGDALSSEFARMPATVAGATTQVQNSVTQLIGTLDRLTGTSSAIANWGRSYSATLDRVDARIKESGGVAATFADNFRIDRANQVSAQLTKAVDAYAQLAEMQQTVGVSSAQIRRMGELREQIDNLQRSAASYADSLKRAGLAPGQTVAASVGAGAGRGSINPETVGSMLQKERAQLDARKAFLAEYATAEEKFTIELKKQKEAQGALWTADSETRLREKFFPKKPPTLDFVKGDVGQVKRGLDILTSTYADAERVLDATRAAGLVSERDYYDEKLKFLNLNTVAQVAALQAENAAIEARGRKGQKGLDDERVTADNLAQISILQARAAATAKVMGIEMESAGEMAKRGFEQATAAASEYLATVSRQNQRELSAFGMGDKARGRAASRNQLDDKFQGQRDAANGELRRKEITEAQLAERLALIAATQAKEIDLWEKHGLDVAAAEGNWVNGASSALNTYLEQSLNVASQVNEAFSRGFKGMEDAVANFVVTGKGNFKSFAQSIIADFVRIQTQAALSGIMKSVLGSYSSSVGDATLLQDMGVSGARAIGGPVSAGSLYQVNERGPELLNVGSKQYLMTGSQGGSVSPNAGGTTNHNYNVAAGVSRSELVTALQMLARSLSAQTEQRFRRAGIP